jgi:hypothetical protein
MIWPHFEEAKEDLDGKKPKKSYDAIKKFQNGWITKLLWAKGCVLVGFIHTMKCKVYSLITNKDKFVDCKWDILTKHPSYIVVHDMLRFEVKKVGIHCQRLCTLENMWLYT